MNQDIIRPRLYVNTFGGKENSMDSGENLGYRTPFQDADAKEADEIFDEILRSRSKPSITHRL